jgi:hypothetical protein
MKSLKETIQEFLQNEGIKTEIKTILKPFGILIYNEIYFYILLICVYCVLLFLFSLISLIIMLNLTRQFTKTQSLLDKLYCIQNLEEIL